MTPEILIAAMAAVAVLLIVFGVAARPSEDAVQAVFNRFGASPLKMPAA